MKQIYSFSDSLNIFRIPERSVLSNERMFVIEPVVKDWIKDRELKYKDCFYPTYSVFERAVKKDMRETIDSNFNTFGFYPSKLEMQCINRYVIHFLKNIVFIDEEHSDTYDEYLATLQ